MTRKDCDIIQDLLHLYTENVVNDSIRTYVIVIAATFLFMQEKEDTSICSRTNGRILFSFILCVTWQTLRFNISRLLP